MISCYKVKQRSEIIIAPTGTVVLWCKNSLLPQNQAKRQNKLRNKFSSFRKHCFSIYENGTDFKRTVFRA